MTVTCSSCRKKMPFYPYKKVKTCIKCTLEENFQVIPTRVISVKNNDIVLAVDRDDHGRKGVAE